jgi:hypothetical protein
LPPCPSFTSEDMPQAPELIAEALQVLLHSELHHLERCRTVPRCEVRVEPGASGPRLPWPGSRETVPRSAKGRTSRLTASMDVIAEGRTHHPLG